MKTIEDITVDKLILVRELKSLQENQASKTKIKKCRANIETLNGYISYLQTEPNQSYVTQQLKEVKRKITIPDSRFPDLVKYNDGEVAKIEPKKLRQYYDKKFNVKLLKEQKAALEYLLA